MPRARTRRRTTKRPTRKKKKTTTKRRSSTSRKKKKTAASRRRRNPPKRKRKAAPKRRRAKATTRRRRKTTKRAAPKRRRRRSRTKTRRRTAARRNPPKRRRRTRRRASSKRRRPRRNMPVSRRRRSKRRSSSKRRRPRRNRGVTPVGSIRKQLKDLMRPQTWLVPALHGAIGFGIASAGPSYLARFTGQFGLRNHGMGGVALSGLSTALGAGVLGWVASMLPKKGLLGKCCKGIVKNVAVGGMIATTIRLIHELAPTSMASQYLPRVGGSMGLPAPESVSGMGYYGGAGYGSYPGQYPSYGPLGMIESPEQLVASESFARQINQLDGMGQPVPVEDIADWMQLSGGMNDWVEFTPGSPYAAQAAAGDPNFPGSQSF